MRDITNELGTLYHPVKALVIYTDICSKDCYVEAHDMDDNGYPINAHPLSVKESTSLSKMLDTAPKRQHGFLHPQGLMPSNVLHTNGDGYMLWYTPAQRQQLLFTKDLQIPDGIASLPPLLWKASRDSLYIYSIPYDTNISLDTQLAYAPFFNIYEDGKVCMGTVNTDMRNIHHLEAFITQWQQYFFNSYFSHLIRAHAPVKGNIIQLWQQLVGSRRKFPVKQLIPTQLTIKDLIV